MLVPLNKRLNSKGRNITFNANASYSTSQNKSFSTSNVALYQVEGSNYSINRYNLTPSKNWNYYAQIAYSEPIADRTYLQFSYRYNHGYSESDRVTYDFSDFTQLSPDYVNLLTSLGLNKIPVYRNWGAYVLDNYKIYEDSLLSRFSEYKTKTHDIEIQFRRVRDNYNFNVGVLVQPQNTQTSFKNI